MTLQILERASVFMIDLIELKLPTSEQLEDYRAMRWALECRPEAVSPEQKLAFCQLVLGMSPGLLDINDVKLVKKLYLAGGADRHRLGRPFYPEEWRAYCEFHWGPPEEQSFFEDGNQLFAPDL